MGYSYPISGKMGHVSGKMVMCGGPFVCVVEGFLEYIHLVFGTLRGGFRGPRPCS